jgi:DNA polymerase-1
MSNSLLEAVGLPTEPEATKPSPRKLTYEDYPSEDLYMYAGVDCITTSSLLGKLWPTLTEQPITIDPDKLQPGTMRRSPAIIQSVIDIEMPSHEFVIDLEINGIGYSVERNRAYDARMRTQIAELEDKIFTGIGKKIDLNSGPAMAEFLYVEKGFTPPFLTKSGEPAVDGAALMTLAGLDPMGSKYETKDPSLQFLGDMAVRRDISSVHNTFIKTYHTDWVKMDGRIHPSYNLFGTSSFRITGSDPNLTQLPRVKHKYNVRTCYTAEPGMVFISFDFSSAEVKVLANMAKEPAMLRAIQDGLDFHTFSASSMYNIPYSDMIGVLSDQ